VRDEIVRTTQQAGMDQVEIGDELTSVGNADGAYRVRVDSDVFPSPLGDSVFVTVLDGAWEGHRIVERLTDLH
jgi:hypothetical protein